MTSKSTGLNLKNRKFMRKKLSNRENILAGYCRRWTSMILSGVNGDKSTLKQKI